MVRDDAPFPLQNNVGLVDIGPEVLVELGGVGRRGRVPFRRADPDKLIKYNQQGRKVSAIIVPKFYLTHERVKMRKRSV